MNTDTQDQDKKMTPEEKKRARLQSIMATIVKSPATTSKPEVQFPISDIAFVIDYLKISPPEVAKIKRELVRKTPIIASVLMIAKEYPNDSDNLMKAWSTLSDDDARKEIIKTLDSLEIIINAAKSANVKTDALRLDIWKLFITALNDPSRKIPINVSTQIQASIIKKRCKVEPIFLQRTRKPFTDFTQLFVENEKIQADIDHPLNTKEQLCPVVLNLNAVSDKSVEKTIKECSELIDKYKSEGLGLTNDSMEYVTIQKDVDNFVKITGEWHDMKTYARTDGSICTSKMDKLKVLADKVRSYAKTCSSSINKQRKTHLKQQAKGSTDTKKSRSWW